LAKRRNHFGYTPVKLKKSETRQPGKASMKLKNSETQTGTNYWLSILKNQYTQNQIKENGRKDRESGKENDHRLVHGR